jgi:hypothetical protein
MTSVSRNNTSALLPQPRNSRLRAIRRAAIGTLALLGPLLLLAGRSHAAEISRHPQEPLVAFATRLLPAGMEIAAKPVELKLSPLGKVAVVLLRPTDSSSNYTGWVLVPDPAAPDSYRKEALPELALANGLFEVEVKSIFAADADADPGQELCVIYSYYRTGSGEEGGYATEVYKWTRDRFARLDPAGDSVVGLRNAKQVRAKFAKQLSKP